MTSIGAERWRGFKNGLKNMGVVQTLIYALQRLRHRSAPAGTRFAVYSKQLRFPVYCRAGTSDTDVCRQILLEREYRCLDDVTAASLIIDCGANIGLSTAYFLSRYPDAFVIAVEPDPGNFAALEDNLRPYRGRFRAIRSAVWSEPVGLVMSEEPWGDGREWARTVRRVNDGEAATMTAVDVGTLLEQSGRDRISILKIDIEGAETALFAARYEDWLGKVDHLVIELHGPECEAAFAAAVERFSYRVARCDELTVCTAIRPGADGAARYERGRRAPAAL